MIKAIIYSSLLLFIVACSSESRKTEQTFFESVEVNQVSKKPVNEKYVSDLIEQIPSPLEISALVKAAGVQYNRKYLSAPLNSNKHHTSHKQALNLGIYNTDLGFANLYQQKVDGLNYLSSIKILSGELKVGQFFDWKKIDGLAGKTNRFDSLSTLTTKNFNSVSQNFQSQDRVHLSVLMLIGGWIEAMDIVGQAASRNLSSQQLKETIGSQKIILDRIMLLVSFYENDPTLYYLVKDLKDLQSSFDQVTISYVYKEASLEIIDGVAVIKDNSITTVDVSHENVLEIVNKTNALRNKLIS